MVFFIEKKKSVLISPDSCPVLPRLAGLQRQGSLEVVSTPPIVYPLSVFIRLKSSSDTLAV